MFCSRFPLFWSKTLQRCLRMRPWTKKLNTKPLLKAFIWGIIHFCTMDGFFRILENTSSELICTRLYLLTVLRYVMTNVHSVYKMYIHTSKVCSNWHWDFRLVSSNQSHFLFPKRLDVKCVVQCDTTQKTQFYHTLH